VRCRRIWVLRETCLVILHYLQHRPGDPLVHLSDVVFFVRIRLNVEHFGISVHWRGTSADSPQDRGAPGAAAAGRYVGKICAELLPTHCHEFRTDKSQKVLSTSAITHAEQEIALVDAVDWPVVGYLAAHEAREGREEVHD